MLILFVFTFICLFVGLAYDAL